MLDNVTPIVPDGMLEGKVTIITGASQGIGALAALGFARAGATVVLAARRAEPIDALAERIRAGGGAVLAVQTDVTIEEDVRNLVDRTLEEFGRLDGALNNAGVDQTPASSITELELEEWRRVFSVKADGTFLSMKYQVPAMRATGGGSIVNVGSAVGERGYPSLAAASASQSAIVGLTKTAAHEFGPEIRVNMLAVGGITTVERAARKASGAATHAVSAADFGYHSPALPMKRLGTSEEVAAVAAWLLSDWSSYQSAAIVPVDGGWLA
jgi:NAD(P)-dependent dehydrogenase (short-subunit alcohol dehydrogenase family)